MRYAIRDGELATIGVIATVLIAGVTIGFCWQSSDRVDVAKEQSRQEEMRVRADLVGTMVLEKKPQTEINAVMDRWNASSDKSRRREELLKYFAQQKPHAGTIELRTLVDHAMKED